ncbi:MAG: UDP-N-acetylmuramate--L-alanine ligase [Rickettsiales bacterium]|jgi:UDP-N-acetylmuramate--alanine ligase|nr:UDP-N-acetylmuramate--L-alanine ligase [Rickettsiales bacterium]
MSSIDLKPLIANHPKGTTIYLSGIGGIGISAIAEMLHHYGFTVIGSDQAANNNTARLQKRGIEIYIGQVEENINKQKIEYLIRSTAVGDGNPEIIAARAKGITILSRAEILAAILKLKKAIIISGSHGKTTTTSLIAHMACSSVIDPSVISGGIMNGYDSNVIIGQGEWLVAEADESDGSFKELSSEISIITNIEAEHMDYFKTEANLKQSFLDYIKKVPASGFNIICYDDLICQELIQKSHNSNIISFGFGKEANIVVSNLDISEGTSRFSISSNTAKIQCDESAVYELALVGKFNVLNAVAAIIVGILLQIDDLVIKRSLKGFRGIQRRMTLTGQVQGIKIYDDYAHHPTEIAVTLEAIKNCVVKPKSKIMAVFQPHRYSRVRDHYNEFIKALLIADKILVTDIYAAGESPIPGISKEAICNDINLESGDKCALIENIDNLSHDIKQYVSEGDVVICLGAGDITKYANLLPMQLSKIL